MSTGVPILQLRVAIGTIANSYVRDVADAYARYIGELNKVQGLLGILHDNVLVVDDMVGGMVGYDLALDRLQSRHYDVFWSLRENMQKMFFCAHEMVRVLEDSLRVLMDLDVQRKQLFSSLGYVNPRLLEIHHYISENSVVQRLVQELFMLESMFKRLVKKWIIFGNQAMADLGVMEVIEHVVAEQQKGGELSALGNDGLVKGILRQLPGLKKLVMVINRGQLRLSDMVGAIMGSWARYHKENAMDPNFYAVFTSDGTYDKLVADYAKVDRALRTEIENLQRELLFLGNRDKAVAQVLAVSSPKLAHLTAQKSNLHMMTKLGSKEMHVFFNEVEHCMNKSGEDLNACLKELSGAKYGSMQKIQNYIDFAKLKQALEGRVGVYTELIVKLHALMAEAVRKEAVRGAQHQAAAYEGILWRMRSLKDEVNRNIKELSAGKRGVYDGILKAMESLNFGSDKEEIEKDKEFLKDQKALSDVRAAQMLSGGQKVITGGSD